jgi:hypothetical protein
MNLEGDRAGESVLPPPFSTTLIQRFGSSSRLKFQPPLKLVFTPFRHDHPPRNADEYELVDPLAIEGTVVQVNLSPSLMFLFQADVDIGVLIHNKRGGGGGGEANSTSIRIESYQRLHYISPIHDVPSCLLCGQRRVLSQIIFFGERWYTLG